MQSEDDGLRDWRRKAADVVLTAAVVLHLPVLLLFLGGYGPPIAAFAKIVIIAGFVVVAAAAVLKEVGHRLRVWALLAVLYSIALLGLLVYPQGPWIRALPVAAPILAIVLIGRSSARIAMLFSAGVLLFAPLLAAIPALDRSVGADGAGGIPLGHIWMQGLGLTADMVVLMIVLEGFYRFLLESLAGERQAAAERTAASWKLEAEVAERRRLQDEIARIADTERRNLGQDVHDGVCQQLTGALLRCQALERRLERGTPPSSADLDALSALLGDTIQEAHLVAKGLCPLDPTPEALAPALRALAKRNQQLSGVACQFRTAGDVRVEDAATAQHLYRLAQEAVSNAVRHARANRIGIELTGSAGELLLRVEDDGVGVPAPLPPGGMGLRTMASRAQVVEGQFAVEHRAGGGTRVSCRIPRAALHGSGHHGQAT